MRTPGHYLKVLKKQERPARFVAARVLARSGLSTRLSIPWNGFQLTFFPSNLSMQMWVDGNARWDDSHFLRRWLQDGDVFVDVGANIGTTVLPAARVVGDRGRVLAVEASPDLAGFLIANVARNGLSNVDVRWSAVGAEHGAITLETGHADDRLQVGQGAGVTVPLVPLDRLTAGLARIALLKVDVEGYEKFVFAGASQTLERTDCIFFESAEKNTRAFGHSTTDVIESIRSCGFDVLRFVDDDVLVHLPPGYRSERCEDLVALRHGCALRSGFSIDDSRAAPPAPRVDR
jgi:FkbM family methyltransferase